MRQLGFVWVTHHGAVLSLLGLTRTALRFVKYAKLGESDTMADAEADEQLISVGDYVSWESGGVLQFEARRVTGVSPDGSFVFVEGTSTGLPKGELTKMEAPQPSSIAHEQAHAGVPRPQVRATGAVTAPAVASMAAGAAVTHVYTFQDEGGAATLQWPTSLSASGVADLVDWLEFLAKKIKRQTEKA